MAKLSEAVGRKTAAKEAAKVAVAEAVAVPPVTQERLSAYLRAGEFVKAERLILTETLQAGAAVEDGAIAARVAHETERDVNFRALAVELATNLIKASLIKGHKDGEAFVKDFVSKQPQKPYDRLKVWDKQKAKE